MRPIDMRVLELLTARLCHELSGPIAAVNNGIELLAEDDAQFVGDAVALVSDSARRARNRLQFYRFAYGYGLRGPGMGASPHEIAVGLCADSRIVCDYPEEIRVLSLEWQKLACNLVAVGASLLPRGGCLALSHPPLTLEVSGDGVALTAEVGAALTLATPLSELTPRTVQAYFTGLLAKTLNSSVKSTTRLGTVSLTAVSNSS
ncbi:MAG TPA: histidine phosphotransferase family protein [Stellaceae bacterium]|nr:histidine phosphotransferase family protein [Stellaceae bacterium]